MDVGGGGGGYGDGVWVNPLKKENLWPKSILQIMLNEVQIICEKWYLLMGKKLIKATKNKRSGGCILEMFIRSTFKTWNIYNVKRACIFIWFCPLRTCGGRVGVLLNGQNPLSVTKVICRQSLSTRLSLTLPVCPSHGCQKFKTRYPTLMIDQNFKTLIKNTLEKYLLTENSVLAPIQ